MVGFHPPCLFDPFSAQGIREDSREHGQPGNIAGRPGALVPQRLNDEAVHATLMAVHGNCQHGTDAHRLGRLSIRFGPQRQVGKRFH